MNRKQNIIKKYYKHLIIFTLIFAVGFYLIEFGMSNQKSRYLKVQTELFKTKYETNYKYFKVMSSDIYAIYQDNTEVINLIAKAKDANETKRSKLRQKLYNLLKRRYRRLKNMGVEQLHFHFPDNISFLRMHKPQKYGDDLTKIRDIVVLTNKTKESQDGFEVGRASHGFRFVYPLFKGKKHIGSVEISYSSRQLIESIVDNFIIHTHFLVSKEEIYNKLYSEQIETLYQDSLENPNYMLETISHNVTANKNIHKSILNNKIVQRVSKRMKDGATFSISNSYNYETTVGSFVAIKNVAGDKTVAYLVIYTESDYLDNLLMEERYIKMLFSTILLLIFMFSIYATLTKNKLEQMAHFDKLTALPNRAYFYIELEQELKRAKRLSKRVAVMFIDLDGFKAVNDTYGHDMGDKLLVEVSKRLEHSVRNVDIVARLGGDEFTIVLCDIKGREDSMLIASKIIANLNEDFIINHEIIKIGASIGISIFPDQAKDSDDLIRLSDSAMYAAKERGKNCVMICTPTNISKNKK